MTKEPTTIAATDRPDDLLPVNDDPPVIASEAEADKAVREMAFVRVHTKEVEASIQRQYDAITQRETAALAIGEKTYAERAADLTTALEVYANKFHPKLKSGNGSRSLQLQSGTIKWVKSRNTVEYKNGKKHKDVIDAIDKETAGIPKNGGGLKARLSTLLGELVLFGRGKAARLVSLFVTPAPKISLTKAREAYDAKKISKDELATLHLVWKKGTDTFIVDPDEFECRT